MVIICLGDDDLFSDIDVSDDASNDNDAGGDRRDGTGGDGDTSTDSVPNDPSNQIRATYTCPKGCI